MRGITFFVCIGKSAWPKIEANSDFIRLVLGPVSFWIMFYDFEEFLAKVNRAVENAEAVMAAAKKENSK
jgi:hypothetical protein